MRILKTHFFLWQITFSRSVCVHFSSPHDFPLTTVCNKAVIINRLSAIKFIANYFERFEQFFQEWKSNFSDCSFLNVNIFRFLCSAMTKNEKSLGCGQKKTSEDTIVGFRKHWCTFISFFRLSNSLLIKSLDDLVRFSFYCTALEQSEIKYIIK